MQAIERAGASPPVLCIHGFCQASAYWDATLDRLAAEGVAGLAPDLPGFAASARLPGPYTMHAYADALVRLLDERGLEKVVVAGGSMGGVVAQWLALRHPARVSRLLLVATGAFTADPVGALAKADALAAAAWNEAAVAPIVAGFFHAPPDAERVQAFRRMALAASQQAAVEAARSNAQSRTFEELPAIAVPTLIIQGRHDRARTPEHGEAMRARIPGARLAVIEAAGHTPQLEAPDAFHALALPFLMQRGQ